MSALRSTDPDAQPPDVRSEIGTDPGRADDEHDRSLIVERLAWTPEQRLEANANFLRFYFSVRPAGPLILDA